MDKNGFDFSFSGLKSAVKRYIDSHPVKQSVDFQKIAFAFEEAVFEVLKHKFFLAGEQYQTQSMVLAGGVSANTHLKEILEAEVHKRHLQFFAPTRIVYSQDNAAMIGIRAYYEIQKNQ